MNLRHSLNRTFINPLLVGIGLSCTQAMAGDWPVFGGNWDHQRHTASSQITPANVAQLDTA